MYLITNPEKILTITLAQRPPHHSQTQYPHRGIAGILSVLECYCARRFQLGGQVPGRGYRLMVVEEPIIF